jgi:hypothetical protein
LTYGGVEFLMKARPWLWEVVWESGELGVVTVTSVPEASYDVDTHCLEQTFVMGRVKTVYRPESDRLGLSVTFTNTSSRPIRSLTLSALKLVFPETPTGPGWYQTLHTTSEGVDGPAAVIANYGSGTVIAVGERVIGDEEFEPELRLQLYSDYDTEHRVYNLKLSSLSYSATDRINADRPLLQPGKSVTFECSLRFGTPNSGLTELAADVFAKYAEQFPRVLKWDDRRPIGMLVLASSDAKHRSPTNPRGWFSEPKLDALSPRGRSVFRQRALAWASRSATECKARGAQGIIAWDIEGEEFPQIVFVGDPRKLPELAPEFDTLADEFFRVFTAAGLKTGVCIRPSRIYRSENANASSSWRHGHMAFDPIEEMADKIVYAKKRWGCTLFYIDTNVTWAFSGEEDEKGQKKVDSWEIRADMMRRLAKAHPDVLLIPEFQYLGYYSHLSGYRELKGGHASTSARVLAAYPDAFSVINVADGDMRGRRNELLAAVKQGDILMFRAWSNFPENASVQYFYRQAAATAGKGKVDDKKAASRIESGK